MRVEYVKRGAEFWFVGVSVVRENEGTKGGREGRGGPDMRQG